MTKYGYLFPGQGSQKVGMGLDFKNTLEFEEHFEIANQALGFDLKKLCLSGPAEELTLTNNAQPAILTISLIAYRIFSKKNSVTPIFAAGHSLGEYSALTAAGAIDFADAVSLVHKRGLLMQDAVKSGIGGMAAILGKKNEEIEKLCADETKNNEVVELANYNCPGQIVISGHINAVKRVLSQVKGVMLEVSAPFHSSLMEPVGRKLREELSRIDIKKPAFPIIANYDVSIHENSSSIVDSLVKQVSNAVRWEECVQLMLQNGVEKMIEFGEGKVLSGLLKRISKETTCENINNLETIHNFQ